MKKDNKGNLGKRYLEYWNAYNNESNEAVGSDLELSSIRIYENNEYELLIFHMGVGDKPKDMNGIPLKRKESIFTQELNKIEDAIYIEPILHHGKGFDYYILKEKK